MAKNDKILFEIKEHIGTISNNQSGWDKELNIISWNGQNTPKFDIRAWNEDHTHMARGITLYSDEMQALVDLYSDWKKRNRKSSGSAAYRSNEPENASPVRTGSENAGGECRNDESASLGRDCSTGDDEGIPFAHSGKEHLNDNTAAVN